MLHEDLPAFDVAVSSLRSLTKNDVVEITAMRSPSRDVRMFRAY